MACFRAGLGVLLASDPDLEVVGDCEMRSNALEVLRRSEADVVLLEFASGLGPGADTVSAATSAEYHGRFLALTRSTDVRNSAMAFTQGASGVFLETELLEKLMQAIKLVANGGIWVDQKIVQPLVEHILNRPARLQDQACSPFQDDRQRRVLLGIVNGLTNEKIGENIGVSERAVKNVVQRLFDRARRAQAQSACAGGTRRFVGHD